ncbi:MAG: hypothetical protein M3037_09725 [Gemmatimonadota bacterium]|nr:hypothetical protein [Gemmatimonadota bacterium]
MARSAIQQSFAMFGLAALVVSGCSKPNREGILGHFPIIDQHLVVDYAKPLKDPLREFYRIHMDVAITDPTKFGEFQKAMDGGKEDEAYRVLQSVLPPEDAQNKRAHAVVYAALDPATTPPAGGADSRGTWPHVNLELVTDYANPIGNELHQFFRIHLDIPISDATTFTDLRKALEARREGDAYKIIRGTLPPPAPENKRAYAVVDAALGVTTK